MEKKNPTIWNEELWQQASRQNFAEARAEAWKHFVESGFPTSKNEAWRYTPLSSIAGQKFHFSQSENNQKAASDYLRRFDVFSGWAKAVFLDGRFLPQASDLSLFAGKAEFISVGSMADAAVNLKSGVSTGALDSLNAALFQDGFWLRISSKEPAPLIVCFLQSSSDAQTTAQIRSWISAAPETSLRVLEWHDHLTDAPVFWNQQLDIHLETAASMEHVRVQRAAPSVWMRSASKVSLDARSRYQRLDLEFGANVSRNEIEVHFGGGEAFCDLSGTALGSGKQHFDTQIVMNHAVPAAGSSQTFRNLLSGNSRGVFGGCVLVRKDAQKTDARQVHKTLLLSKQARADVKPQLRIDADDVQCSHGAAIGQLAEDNLFYLQSRGISRVQAEKMLAAGFVQQLLDPVSDASLRTFLQAQMDEQLSRMFS